MRACHRLAHASRAIFVLGFHVCSLCLSSRICTNSVKCAECLCLLRLLFLHAGYTPFWVRRFCYSWSGSMCKKIKPSAHHREGRCWAEVAQLVRRGRVVTLCGKPCHVHSGSSSGSHRLGVSRRVAVFSERSKLKHRTRNCLVVRPTLACGVSLLVHRILSKCVSCLQFLVLPDQMRLPAISRMRVSWINPGFFPPCSWKVSRLTQVRSGSKT